MTEKIVGHKTYWNDDGTHRHEPLTESEADKLLEHVEAARVEREKLIPDQEKALRLLHDCYTRLGDMGWRSPPKFTINPGKYKFKVITYGSTGVFDITCNVGEDGKFNWWYASHWDLWPITPLMVKEVKEA